MDKVLIGPLEKKIAFKFLVYVDITRSEFMNNILLP